MTPAWQPHPERPHVHGAGCGHTAVPHDGHLHQVHGDHVDDQVAITPANPAQCTPAHAGGHHTKSHQHGPGCGHEAVPHGGHTDYLVAGHLHHPHGTHCDDHGRL